MKPTIEQSFPTDYYAFVEHSGYPNHGPWIVDSKHYQDLPETMSPLDDGKMVNTLLKNKHPYMQHKFYKAQFHRLPQLQRYRYIVWMDSQYEIGSKDIVRDLIKQKGNATISIFNHYFRKSIREECVVSAKDERWKNTTLWGIKQPFQNVTRQTEYYYASGFSDSYLRNHCNEGNYGLFVCAFFVIDMDSPKAVPLMDDWYLQMLNHTTQDQIAFPYSAWKTGIYPKTIPGVIIRNSYIIFRGHYK